MNRRTNGVTMTIGEVTLRGRLEWEMAPKSCDLFLSLIEHEHRAIHCRWSGESVWIPFAQPRQPLPFENHTSHPFPGQVLIYAAGFSEPEILIPYGACSFNSKVGLLAGNHFLTLEAGTEMLPSLGRTVLWEGAQTVRIHEG